MSIISDLATSIFETEFDSNTGIIPESYIQAWLESNLGALNSKINTSYSGVDAQLDLESQSIYKELYMGSYYRKQARNSLVGIVQGSNGSNILSLRDGPSSMSFTNKNEVSKSFAALANACDANVAAMAHAYNMYQSFPRQLGGVDGIYPIVPTPIVLDIYK